MALPAEDFYAAARTFVNTCEQHYELRPDWPNVSVLRDHSIDFLSITQFLRSVPARECEQRSNKPASVDVKGDADVEDADDEAIVKTFLRIQPTVKYDLVYSESYQVPVLYLIFEDLDTGRQPGVDELYDLLVPESTRSQMQSLGVMGALSLTEHPAMGCPAFFVHPCRTQEAMEPLIRGRDVRPLEYLMLWLGVVGSSVGLNVPIQLAEVLGKMLGSDEHGKGGS